MYKLGDKVKIRKDLIIGETYGTDDFVEKMEEYRGKTATITNIYDNKYDIDIDDVKWLLTEQRDMVYNTLYQSINDYLMNDINKICIVNKPFTEDDVIRLCNEIENNSWTKFENGVIKIDKPSRNDIR